MGTFLPLGLDSLGKNIMLAFIRFTPDEDTSDIGSIYTRKMKGK